MRTEDGTSPQHRWIEDSGSKTSGDAATTVTDLMDAIDRSAFVAAWARVHPKCAPGVCTEHSGRPSRN